MKKDFIWFERKNIRNENSLNSKDIEYIQGRTISPFGFVGILYLVFRRLYDVITLYIIFYVSRKVFVDFINIKALIESNATLGAFYTVLFLLATLVGLYALIFIYRHGRRLSWNRGKWKSVEELRKSENKWFYFNTMPSIIFLVLIFGFIYLTY